MDTYRQLVAVTRLVARQWTRMSPRLRGGAVPKPTHGASAILLRLLFFVFWGGMGIQWAHLLQLNQAPLEVAAWVAMGLTLITFGMGFASELPTPRMPPSPLKSPLLEMLPLSHAARLLLMMAQSSPIAVFAITFSVSARRGTLVESLAECALALSLYVSLALWGTVFGKLLRRVLSAYWAARASWLTTLFTMGGILGGAESMLLVRVGWRAPFGQSLAHAFFGEGVALQTALLSALALPAVLCWVLLERQSVDQLEPIKSGFIAARLRSNAGPMAVERLLQSREPGGRILLPMMMLLSSMMAVAILLLTFKSRALLPPRITMNFALVVPLQLVLTVGVQRAIRGATRDSLARPLLGSLPITPFDTISAKIKVLRRDLMLMIAPCFLVVGYAWRDPHALPMIAWRLLAFAAAVLIYSRGAVAVAFLTLGLGGTRPRAGAYGSLDSLLLVFPCIGVVFAEGPWGAILSLASLLALSFEARRAATKVVDWLDDPAAEHGTELWRSLVVFAAFQASQLLLGQLLQLFGALLSDMQRAAITYLVTGTGLWFICQLQQTSTPLEPGARRAGWGFLAGGAAAGFAWIYLRVLAYFTPPELHHPWASPLEQVLLSLAMVFVAPMAEERFFRGWLLTEIKLALGTRPYLAILISAFAFAVVHPPVSFAPVLVLGLLTGILAHFKRSLFACVVAHAVYNAAMLLQ